MWCARLRRTFSIVFFFSSLLSASSAPANPELVLTIAGEANDAYVQFQEAVEQFHQLRTMLIDAEQGKKPPPQGDTWRNLVEQFRARSDEVRRWQIPTNFDPAGYAVSLDDIAQCRTRQWALSRLNGYLGELRVFQARGTKAKEHMTKLNNAIRRVSSDFHDLLRLHERSAGLSTEIALNWWDLSQHVVPATDELKRLYEEKGKEVDRVVELISGRIGNLEANLNTLNASECILPESWTGTVNVDGTITPITLSIKLVSGKYRIVYGANGRINTNTCTVRVEVSARVVEYRPSCNPPNDLVTRLRISDDYVSMSGEMTDDADPSARFIISLTAR